MKNTSKKNDEQKKAKKAALIEKRRQKKAEARAKKAAKRAAALEKKRAKLELKKQKCEEKKAKKAARLQKLREKKAAIREKKKAAALKARERAKAKKLREKAQLKKVQKQVDAKLKKNNDAIDIKEAAKNIKLAMTQIANEMAKLDDEARAKKAKSIRWMGYDVETSGTELKEVIVRFDVEKSKKIKIENADDPVKEKKPRKPRTPKVVDEQPTPVVEPTIIEPEEVEEPKVELVPAGDLLATDGEVDEAEVANIDNFDETFGDDNDENLDDENFIPDSRDEQDDDLVDNRKEFFSEYGDDGEMNG